MQGQGCAATIVLHGAQALGQDGGNIADLSISNHHGPGKLGGGNVGCGLIQRVKEFCAITCSTAHGYGAEV